MVIFTPNHHVSPLCLFVTEISPPPTYVLPILNTRPVHQAGPLFVAVVLLRGCSVVISDVLQETAAEAITSEIYSRFIQWSVQMKKSWPHV